jgi:serine/threonine-protein kinase
MSPEQAQSAWSADARSDVWSIGTVLYELLTRRLAFDGETMPAIIAAIIASAPPPLRALRPDVASGLEAAVMRCLEKAPERRFGSIGQLAAAIAPFGPPGSAGAVDRIARTLKEQPAPTLPAATGQTQGMPAPTPKTAAEWSREAAVERAPSRSRAPFTAAVVLASASAGVAWWVATQHARATAAPAVDATAAAEASSLPPESSRASMTAALAPASSASKPMPSPAIAVHPSSAGGPAFAPTHDPSKSPVCARLLERQSLGEELEPRERALFIAQCRR